MRCSQTHRTGSSTGARSSTSAPRCGAPSAATTPASRSGRRSTSPTAAACACSRAAHGTSCRARERGAALSGVESLTPAEHRVATLAADGCTNREIAEQLYVSQRTVETHLTHVFQKLDIASRSELAAVCGDPAPAFG